MKTKNSYNIFTVLKLSFGVLAVDRKRFNFAVFLCVIGGAFELVGVGTLYPFLALLSKPELIETNEILHSVYNYFQFENVTDFLLLSGWIALIIFFIATLFLFFKNAYIIRFCTRQNSQVSVRMLEAFLRKDMLFHIGGNSGALSKDVIEQSDQFTNGVLLSVMTLLADGLILIVLIALILLVDLKAGLVMTFVIGTVLIIVLEITRKKVHEYGVRNDEGNSKRFVFVVSVLQSVKEVKVSGKESFFANLFRIQANELARCYSNLNIIQLIPQSVMQFVAAGSVIGMALYFISAGVGIEIIVPTLGLYAVAGYRLMPSANKIAGAISQLRQFQPAIQNVSKVLGASSFHSNFSNKGICDSKCNFTAIDFKNIKYQYPDTDKFIFENLSVSIACNSFVSLVGPSGSGKSTLVDLLLGLLKPMNGEITVNGKSIMNLGEDSWRKLFSYVPQTVYIVDGTIAENIAFGVSVEDIDWNWMQRVISLCHLEDLINEQANGFHASVGERGSMLSGGQKQRIGIARALYQDAPILILDESTSSLDGITEKAIIKLLHELSKSKTIISISHRDSIVRQCDRVIMIDQGQVLGDGTYEELLHSSSLFSSLMAELERM